MPIPLEQRVRLLEGRVCTLEKILAQKLGILTLEIMGIEGSTMLFSEELVNRIILYIDREGMPLRVIEGNNNTIPSARQAVYDSNSGTIYLDPSNPINIGGEVFSIIYSTKH